MIPIRDETRTGTYPVVTLALIAVNVAIFFYSATLGSDAAWGFIDRYGLQPYRVWNPFGDGWGPIQAFGPFLSAMFLHGDIMHLLGNMWFLWLAGDNVEDRLGHRGFIGFYLLCGLAASVAHVVFAGQSMVPMIGASGAIAGVLGAYLMSFPRARVLTLIPIFFFLYFIRLPAWLLIGLWFLVQVASAMAADPAAPGVAWWAHVGGFVAGVALVVFWPKRQIGPVERRYMDYGY